MLMISLESPDVIKIMDTSIIHPNMLIKKKMRIIVNVLVVRFKFILFIRNLKSATLST